MKEKHSNHVARFVDWATLRGIDCPKAQRIKLDEELKEFANKLNSDANEWADCFCALSILDHLDHEERHVIKQHWLFLAEFEPDDADKYLGKCYARITKRKGRTINKTFYKDSDIFSTEKTLVSACKKFTVKSHGQNFEDSNISITIKEIGKSYSLRDAIAEKEKGFYLTKKFFTENWNLIEKALNLLKSTNKY